MRQFVLLLSSLVLTAHAQVNEACYPWRTTVSALPFGDPGIFGYSAEEVCRALVARSGNPQLVNGGTVRVFKTFTGLVGDPGTGGYCGIDRQAFSVATGEPVPSESGPYNVDGVGRQHCWPSNSGACRVSNPTDPALGIKTEAQVDYAGAGAHPLSLVRSYRSVAMTPSNFAATSVWRHNYGMALELRSHPGLGAASLVARRADGSGLAFSQVADGTWRAISTTRDALRERRDTAGSLLGYSYVAFEDNSTETYDTSGRLLAIAARNGWLTTLAYDAEGRLSSVRNHFGRELRFTYDAAGRLAELLPPGAVSGAGAGSATSPIRYQYDEAASLGVGVVAQGQLSSVTWQDGSVRRYHYEDNRWPQALTGITDESGVRWATYSYDGNGRVIASEHAGGTDRFSFTYAGGIGDVNQTTVTDYTGATVRTLVYSFADIGGTRYPVSVSAPCSLCGSTAQNTAYNAAGEKTKEVAHDGTVTFFAYDAKGHQTERATFPSSYATATTRPALANASKVTSTKWHASFNLPTQIAEPNKLTTRSYNAKGMLTAESWTATTDATGAAKFTAVKTGSTYATGWGYNANSLATSIVTRETAAGATVAVETGRWTLAVNASGDVTRVTDVTDNNLTGRATQYDVHGRLLSGTTPSGSVSMAFDLRGRLTSYTAGTLTMRFQWTPFGELQRIDGPGTDVVIYEYDAAQRLTGVRKQLTYVAVDEPALVRFAQALRRLIESPIPVAHAQVVLPPLVPVPAPFTPAPRGAPPVPTDPTEALMPSRASPDPNRELARRLGDSIQSVIDRLLCSPECKRLQAEIQTIVSEVRWRYFSMMVDKNNLFCTRPEGRGSWRGHQQQYSDKQTKLRKDIDRARAINCPYNPEADDWVGRPPPVCPG
jgi:YD repeat-containing protein